MNDLIVKSNHWNKEAVCLLGEWAAVQHSEARSDVTLGKWALACGSIHLVANL